MEGGWKVELGLGLRGKEEGKGYCVVGRLPGRQAFQCGQVISKSVYKKAHIKLSMYRTRALDATQEIEGIFKQQLN